MYHSVPGNVLLSPPPARRRCTTRLPKAQSAADPRVSSRRETRSTADHASVPARRQSLPRAVRRWGSNNGCPPSTRPVLPHREERCHALQAAVSGSVNSLGRVLFTVRSLYFSASGFVPVFQPCVRCTTLIQAALPSSSTRGYARSLLSNRVDAVTQVNTGDQNERVDGGAAWLSQHRHEGLSPSVYSIPRLCHSRQPSTPRWCGVHSSRPVARV